LIFADNPLFGGPGDPTLTVTENGKTLGTISMNITNNDSPNARVTGTFTVTAKDPQTGQPYTLDALAKSLGEDHFNWLQDYTASKDISITSLNGDINNPQNGDPTITRTYTKGESIIDPQSGGMSFDKETGVWDDNAPWYYNEPALPKSVTPPDAVISQGLITWQGKPSLELSAKSSGSTLSYADQPLGRNVTLSFTTFLVSVGPGNTYKPLAGFTWSEKFDNGFNGTITLDADGGNLKSATFSKDIDKEINSQGFGKWALAPEPSTLLLLASSLMGIVPFGLGRRILRSR
jgi:hypothetical protein